MDGQAERSADGILHHVELRPSGERPESWIWFLHGIYGTGRNWATLARKLTGRRPDWGALLVDLRLHGRSRGFPPPHDLAACAADLERLAGRAPSPRALLGHSFGGKVALERVRARPPGVRQVWVVDSTPAPRRAEGSAWEMLRALRELPAEFESRAAGVAALRERGFDAPVASWMATNLERRDGGYRWPFRPEDMEALLEDFAATDLWDTATDPPPGTAIHFLKAEGSDVLDEAACGRIEAAARAGARVALHRVAGGHWLNVDNPEAVLDLLERELPDGEALS